MTVEGEVLAVLKSKNEVAAWDNLILSVGKSKQNLLLQDFVAVFIPIFKHFQQIHTLAQFVKLYLHL